MKLLEGTVRTYDWGSPTAIPDLLGRPRTGEPWAEVWFGAHPLGPATLVAAAVPLDSVIAADPVAALGSAAAARFGRLPFLVKLLAAAAPLSLQCHPSAEQAQAGFEREEALGIPRGAPQRMFRDRSHKPELVCALTPFEALCGFRDPACTAELLDTLEAPALDPLRRRLRRPSDVGMRDVLGWLLALDAAAAGPMVDAAVGACSDGGGRGRETRPDSGGPGGWAAVRDAVARLGARYPGDGGVIAALLLNHVVLAPGEAMFLAPGRLHAYLGGMAVEVMADSDNVVRGGLTSKHVDAGTLLEVADFAPDDPAVQRPEPVDGIVSYRAPAAEFALSRVDLDGSVTLAGGPAILLCTGGRAEANGASLCRGRAAWAPATEQSLRLEGRATVFRAGLGAEE